VKVVIILIDKNQISSRLTYWIKLICSEHRTTAFIVSRLTHCWALLPQR